KKNLSVKLSYQNALVIGGTGTGKSSVVLIPSLFSMRSSFVVNDPSGELYSKTAGHSEQRGYEIKILNFTDPTVSCGYNPLARAQTSSEIQKVASLLIENSLGKGKDPFWNTQAIALLSMLITILKKQEPQFQNLYNVRQLLNQLGGNHEAVDSFFSRFADEILFAEYKSFIAYDDKVVNGVIATCKAALQIFSDEAVASVTSFDNLNFQDFRNKPVVLFIRNSVADQKYYSVLTSILFEQFFTYVLSRFPKDNEQDIFLLIDEASSLNLPTLPLAVANVRKHRGGVMLLVQDFAQIVHHYGRYDADAIKSNCFAKMYFTGQSLETTKELESTLGKFEYKDDKGHKVVRALMTNDEIRTIKSSRAILICGNKAPIMAKLVPYYKNPVYRKLDAIKHEIKGTIPFTKPPVLDLTNLPVNTNE
ncbi:MAG TPA: type IV secretory system conjugative DNA transfer family protein, partial [Bacteroidia bacterium]|nr:type IV secretory system conjugative DNA transfer family protein [Bacteroidia bacterium]